MESFQTVSVGGSLNRGNSSPPLPSGQLFCSEVDRGGASHGGNDVGYYGDASVRAARAAGRAGNDN